MLESMKGHRKSSRCRASSPMLQFARIALQVGLLLVLLVAAIKSQAQASPLLLASGQDRVSSLEGSKSVAGSAHSQQMSPSKQNINVLEDLIFRAIDDMGDRLKKNKLHSIKQTLRFGRSDPSMAPTSPDDDLDDGPKYARPMEPFADYDKN